MKLHPGPELRIFHILPSEDIDAFKWLFVQTVSEIAKIQCHSKLFVHLPQF